MFHLQKPVASPKSAPFSGSCSFFSGTEKDCLSRVKSKAFTLVEMVIVITITGILTLVIVPMLARPFSLFQDMRVRAALVDRAQLALATISREVRQVVPNSIRATGAAVELMPTSFAGRYPAADIAADIDTLAVRQLDSNFSVMANVPSLSGQRLIVHPSSTAILYAATANAIARTVTPSTTTITVSDNGIQDRITLNPAFRFDPTGNGSPSRRIFASPGPVSYVCSAGDLVRYEGYSASVTQPTNPLSPPLAAAATSIISDAVAQCQFRYSPGTAQRSALLTLEITLTEHGESIQLIDQVHMENAP